MSEGLLAGEKLLDFGTGMSAALVAKLLVEFGAQTTRIEPALGDPFYHLLPAYRIWHLNKTIIQLDDAQALDPDLIQQADICICGGDDYPGLKRRYAAEALSEANPRLIVLQIDAAPAGMASAYPGAVELLMQARLGICNEVFGTHPAPVTFPVAGYGAALLGAIGIWAALYERERSGLGQVVRTSLLQGAMVWLAPMWLEVEKPAKATRMIVPRNARHHIFRCADGVCIHLSPGVPNAMGIVSEILGMANHSAGLDARGMPAGGAGSDEHYFGDIDLIQRHAGTWGSTELVATLRAKGIPVEYVLQPGECWDEPQVILNGIIKHGPAGEQYVGLPICGLEVRAT
jgi:crotonobetainyl-CoA:carnitine CoA-transferase CaiB-like acyl-CoA transferase